jgi:hypothetical protein
MRSSRNNQAHVVAREVAHLGLFNRHEYDAAGVALKFFEARA